MHEHDPGSDQLVCLSVCPSVREHISETTHPNFIEFSVRPARGRRVSVLGWLFGVVVASFVACCSSLSPIVLGWVTVFGRVYHFGV